MPGAGWCKSFSINEKKLKNRVKKFRAAPKSVLGNDGNAADSGSDGNQ